MSELNAGASPTQHCRRCKKVLGPGEERRIPAAIKLPGALALGPFHAGMWLWQELSLPYCARCRAWLSFLSLLFAAFMLTLAILAFRWAYVAFDIR